LLGLEFIQVLVVVEVEALVDFAGEVTDRQVVNLVELVGLDQLAYVVSALVNYVLICGKVLFAEHLSFSYLFKKLHEFVSLNIAVFVFVERAKYLCKLS
jgi:hypothetical protein